MKITTFLIKESFPNEAGADLCPSLSLRETSRLL
jgi:hypothetical protein